MMNVPPEAGSLAPAPQFWLLAASPLSVRVAPLPAHQPPSRKGRQQDSGPRALGLCCLLEPVLSPWSRGSYSAKEATPRAPIMATRKTGHSSQC